MAVSPDDNTSLPDAPRNFTFTMRTSLFSPLRVLNRLLALYFSVFFSCVRVAVSTSLPFDGCLRGEVAIAPIAAPEMAPIVVPMKCPRGEREVSPPIAPPSVAPDCNPLIVAITCVALLVAQPASIDAASSSDIKFFIYSDLDAAK